MKSSIVTAGLELLSDRLVQAVGRAHVSLDDHRLTVRPGSAAEIVDVLRIAGEGELPVGVGVKSGVDVDLHRMHNVLHFDETSLLVSAQAGITWSALELLLGERGLTLGPMPPTSRERTIGALLSAPRASEANPRAGRFTQQAAAVAGVLADGTEISTRLAPRKATGPDLMHALVGTRGTIGLISSASLRVFRRGEAREEASFRFRSDEDALGAARALLVAGGRPFDLAVTPQPATLTVTAEGALPHADAERELAERICRARGGEPVPFQPPPPLTRAAHERFVPLERIEAAVPARDGRTLGWHALGAAVVDPTRPPELPSADPLTLALKRRLDAKGRLPAWPGA